MGKLRKRGTAENSAEKWNSNASTIAIPTLIIVLAVMAMFYPVREQDATSVIIFANGDNGTNGVEVFVTSENATAVTAQFGAVRLFNADGLDVTKISGLADVPAGEKLYAVPEGLHFMWPVTKIGSRRIVQDIDTPTDSPISIEAINESPRVFMIHNFLSEVEADALINHALQADDPVWSLQRSAVGSANTDGRQQRHQGKGKPEDISSVRTSDNAFDSNSKTASRIKRRAFQLLRINPYVEAHADGVQILRYQLGQAYIPHHDYYQLGQVPNTSRLSHNWDPRVSSRGSNRFATVFLYLSDVEEGGQTVFPDAAPSISAAQQPLNATLQKEAVAAVHKLCQETGRPCSWEPDMVDKCYSRLSVRPRKGNAILFYSQDPDGRLDQASLHGGCPVLAGTKWAANVWVWNRCRYQLCGSQWDSPTNEDTQATNHFRY